MQLYCKINVGGCFACHLSCRIIQPHGWNYLLRDRNTPCDNISLNLRGTNDLATDILSQGVNLSKFKDHGKYKNVHLSGWCAACTPSATLSETVRTSFNKYFFTCLRCCLLTLLFTSLIICI